MNLRSLGGSVLAATIVAASALALPSTALAAPAVSNSGNGPVGWDTYRKLDQLSELNHSRTKQFSSFARDGSNGDGFSGAFSCLRQDASGCVIAEDNGPGEVQSLWFTQVFNGHTGNMTATGWIKIELDGRVILQRSLQELVEGKEGAPFAHPLVANADQSSGGVYVKVPMPYRSSMKITTQNNPNFYHVTYRDLASADGVTTFDRSDKAEDVLAVLRASGTRDPKPAAPGAVPTNRTVTVPAGGKVSLAQLTGSGSINSLRLKLPAHNNNLRLRITFDGRTTVDSPVGEFFGSALAQATVRSLMFAMSNDGWHSSWWPMPYRQSAHVELVNPGPAVQVTSEISSAPRVWTGNEGHFGTQSRADRTKPDQDWYLADVQGSGKFVGVTHTMRGRTPGRYYLEGDERVRVDSSPAPSIHGTGTEDFYESGWYFDRGEFSNPFNGNPRHLVNRDGCVHECDGVYRLMLGDSVGFGSALRFGIEHGQQNDFDADYASTAYLYTRPEVSTKRTDVIDAGDVASRSAHGWTEAGGTQTSLSAQYEGDDDDVVIKDDVRSSTSPVSFKINVNGVALLRRISDQNAAARADMLVDGVQVGTWVQPLRNGTSRWLEDSFTLPATTKSQVTVTLRPQGTWTAAQYLVDSLVPAYADTTAPSAPAQVRTVGTKVHSIGLEWSVAADNVGADSYRIYGSRGGSSETLVGTSRVPQFRHTALKVGETWSYRVAAVDASGNEGARSAAVSGKVRGSNVSDVDGDGRDDVLTFTRGEAADVYAATSTGSAFTGTAQKWHDHFAVDQEVPMSGDFDGDGKADVITFTKGNGRVYVSLSDGSRFVQDGWMWHGVFAPGAELPLVGDFNGDGRDDIATFTRGDSADVFVALSNGRSFVGTGWKWHDHFAVGGETPVVGDINGDGRDDIVTFTGTAAYAAVSTGSSFSGDGVRWHDNLPGEPALGDVDGDGRDDVVLFNGGQVTVARSTGTSFGATSVWHPHFAVGGEVPGVGDFTGDGRADIVTFTRGTSADAYVATSTGTSFSSDGVKWHDWFAAGGELPRPSV